MFKPNTLLKVVSILVIIFAALGLVASAFSYIMLSKMGDIQGIDPSLMDAATSPLSMVISFASGIALLVAGIIGVSGKSAKLGIICMVLYIVLILVSLIQNAGTLGISFFAIIDFVLPLLYLWGMYQSK